MSAPCVDSAIVPNLAQMSIRHELPNFPGGLTATSADDELSVALPGGPAASFRPISEGSLSSRRAAEIAEYASNELAPRLFVVFRRSSPAARSLLREAGVSFAGDDGYVFVHAPGIHVERDDPLLPRGGSTAWADATPERAVRNPFSNRSSRVARFMLGHPDQEFSPTSLAQATELNAAAVSRILTALEDAAFIAAAESDPVRGRKRTVVLRRPLALLEEWLPLWQRRRIQRLRWDIGARDADEALQLLAKVDQGGAEWAVGGLAGAATLNRAVEPASVALWVRPEAVESLATAVRPVQSRGGRGTVEVALAPDPWTLGLSRPVNRLPIADPVQLWLDCASEGERALEAADAVAQVMSWS